MLHGGSGNLENGGSYLTMTSPDGTDFSVVIETAHAQCPVCSANNAAAPGAKDACAGEGPAECAASSVCRVDPGDSSCSTTPVASNVTQSVTIALLGTLARTVQTVHVWHTNNSTRSFFYVGAFSVKDGAITLAVEPESIYTVTTTAGQCCLESGIPFLSENLLEDADGLLLRRGEAACPWPPSVR